MKCYYNEVEINENNKSVEHVIPKSIGGRLTSSKILCKSCNNTLGGEIDIELFEQFKFASVYFGFSEKNQIKLKTLFGEELVTGKGLAPYFRMTKFIPGSDKEQFIWTKDRASAIKQVDLNKKQVESKYPDLKLNYNEYINENRGKIFYIIQKNAPKAGEIYFGGDAFFKAIIKMSIGYAYETGVELEFLKKAISILKGEMEIISNFFYPNGAPVRNCKSNDISHILFLKGDRKRKLLYVYSELFSFSNHITILNAGYDGPDVESVYHYDLVQKKEIGDTKITLKLNQTFGEDYRAIFDSMYENNAKHQKYLFNDFMANIEKMQLQY